MKAVFLFIGICICSLCNAQDLNFLDTDDVLITTHLDYTAFPDRSTQALGLSIEYFMTENWSVQYAGMIGQTSEGNLYLYSGLGQTGFYLGIRYFQPDQLYVYLIIISLIIPEGISYSVPVGKRTRVGMYLSPIGFDFEKDLDSNWEDYHISFEYGIKTAITLTKGIYLTPQLGIKSHYNELSMNPSVGLGFQFKM